MNYLIINLPESRRCKQVVYWAAGEQSTTHNPHAAMLVSEEAVNKKLDRYDNGRTTQAVLASVAQAHNNPWNLISAPAPLGGVA
ncbi:MAG: hypothetical protein ACPGPF_01765 [Pontibacterium sp.]